jgi:hypothetical protein
VRKGTFARFLLILVLCGACSGCLITAGIAATGAAMRYSKVSGATDRTYYAPAAADSVYTGALAVLSKDGIVEKSDPVTRRIVATDAKKYWRYTVSIDPTKDPKAAQMEARTELFGNWDDGHVGDTTTSEKQTAFIYALSSQLGGIILNPVSSK